MLFRVPLCQGFRFKIRLSSFSAPIRREYQHYIPSSPAGDIDTTSSIPRREPITISVMCPSSMKASPVFFNSDSHAESLQNHMSDSSIDFNISVGKESKSIETVEDQPARKNTENETRDRNSVALYQELKRWRSETSRVMQKAPYLLFNDKTLELIVRYKPHFIEALTTIPGIKNRLRDREADVINIIKRYSTENDSAGVEAIQKDLELNKVPSKASKTPKVKKTRKVLNKESTADAAVSELDEVLNIHRVSLDKLTEEQQHAAAKALSGQNLFITGAAGTGKVYSVY